MDGTGLLPSCVVGIVVGSAALLYVERKKMA